MREDHGIKLCKHDDGGHQFAGSGNLGKGAGDVIGDQRDNHAFEYLGDDGLKILHQVHHRGGVGVGHGQPEHKSENQGCHNRKNRIHRDGKEHFKFRAFHHAAGDVGDEGRKQRLAEDKRDKTGGDRRQVGQGKGDAEKFVGFFTQFCEADGHKGQDEQRDDKIEEG